MPPLPALTATARPLAETARSADTSPKVRNGSSRSSPKVSPGPRLTLIAVLRPPVMLHCHQMTACPRWPTATRGSSTDVHREEVEMRRAVGTLVFLTGLSLLARAYLG